MLSGMCEFIAEFVFIIALAFIDSSKGKILFVISFVFMAISLLLKFINPKNDDNTKDKSN